MERPYPKTWGMAKAYVAAGHWSAEQLAAWEKVQEQGAERYFRHLTEKYPRWGAMWRQTCAEEPDRCPDGYPESYAIPSKDLDPPQEPWAAWQWLLFALILMVLILAIGWILGDLHLPHREI